MSLILIVWFQAITWFFFVAGELAHHIVHSGATGLVALHALVPNVNKAMDDPAAKNKIKVHNI